MRKKPVLKARKEPEQERSRQMREDILTASVRVLRREGALRFTTPRVAEAAGISVGSLYQYFPNKQALVFALHSRIVRAAWVEVQHILDQKNWSAREKARRVTQLYFHAESDDVAEMGPLLSDAEMFFDEQPEHRALHDEVLRRFKSFVRGALPASTSRARVELGAQLLVTVLESVGSTVAKRQLPRRTVNRWATACADMVADYLGFE